MLSTNTKIKLISAGNTFVTAFLLAIAGSLSTVGIIEWTSAFWIALAMAGLRAGLAAIVAQFTPVRLGGKKV
jgi:hypothetical protein